MGRTILEVVLLPRTRGVFLRQRQIAACKKTGCERGVIFAQSTDLIEQRSKLEE